MPRASCSRHPRRLATAAELEALQSADVETRVERSVRKEQRTSLNVGALLGVTANGAEGQWRSSRAIEVRDGPIVSMTIACHRPIYGQQF